MTNSLKRALGNLLTYARSVAPTIHQSDDFLTSNLPLDGQIFIKLTDSSTYTKEERKMTDEGKQLLTEGARQIAITVAEEFYKENDIGDIYQARVLSALQKGPLYAHEVQHALGLATHSFNTLQSTLACLEAKSKIHKVEDFKYALTESDGDG